MGSQLAEHIDIWACELAPALTYAMTATNAPLEEIAYLIDNTSKTRAVLKLIKVATPTKT